MLLLSIELDVSNRPYMPITKLKVYLYYTKLLFNYFITHHSFSYVVIYFNCTFFNQYVVSSLEMFFFFFHLMCSLPNEVFLGVCFALYIFQQRMLILSSTVIVIVHYFTWTAVFVSQTRSVTFAVSCLLICLVCLLLQPVTCSIYYCFRKYVKSPPPTPFLKKNLGWSCSGLSYITDTVLCIHCAMICSLFLRKCCCIACRDCFCFFFCKLDKRFFSCRKSK